MHILHSACTLYNILTLGVITQLSCQWTICRQSSPSHLTVCWFLTLDSISISLLIVFCFGATQPLSFLACTCQDLNGEWKFPLFVFSRFVGDKTVFLWNSCVPNGGFFFVVIWTMIVGAHYISQCGIIGTKTVLFLITEKPIYKWKKRRKTWPKGRNILKALRLRLRKSSERRLLSLQELHCYFI